LTGDPFGTRMPGHAQPQKLSARMPQDEKSIQEPKLDLRHHEQARRDGIGMIVKKDLPALASMSARPRWRNIWRGEGRPRSGGWGTITLRRTNPPNPTRCCCARCRGRIVPKGVNAGRNAKTGVAAGQSRGCDTSVGDGFRRRIRGSVRPEPIAALCIAMVRASPPVQPVLGPRRSPPLPQPRSRGPPRPGQPRRHRLRDP